MDQQIDNAGMEEDQNLEIASLPDTPETDARLDLIFSVICEDLLGTDFPFPLRLEFLTHDSYAITISEINAQQEMQIPNDLTRMTIVGNNGIATSIPFPWPVTQANATFKSGPVWITFVDTPNPPEAIIGKYIRVVVSTAHNA
jgi:hypothetical protein